MREGKNLADFVIRGNAGEWSPGPAPGWRMKILFRGGTSFLDELTVHIGELTRHSSPHPPHSHEHEEFHFALSDGSEFVMMDDGGERERAIALPRGSACFTDSRLPHTFRNDAGDSSSYLHLRWRRESHAGGGPSLHFVHLEGSGQETVRPPRAVQETVVYAGPTRLLAKMVLKRVVIGQLGGVPLHRHDHEVVFAIVAGTVQIQGKRVDAPGFAFFGSRVPHGLSNPALEPALLYAVEFFAPS